MIEELKQRKGELSGKIGRAKKEGLPADELIAEMKAVSAQLKMALARIKEQSSHLVSPAVKEELLDVSLPKLFTLVNADNEPAPSDVTIRECGSDDSVAWNEYVESFEGSSIYHRWDFRSVVEKSFGHQVFYLAAFDSAGTICGVLPAVELKSPLFGHYLVSMPFFNYGSVVSAFKSVRQLLMKSLSEKASNIGAAHTEFRSTQALDGYQCKQNKVSMVLKLPSSIETLRRDIGTKVRAQIKKADRFELKMKFGGSELLSDFYRVFSINMRDLGTPVYSKVFFENILRCVSNQDISVGVVYRDDLPVSCCFLIGYKGMLEIPWASTLSSANSMNANMFMYWNILKKAVDSGYDYFDFGRSSIDASTYRFKKQWGAIPMQQYWAYWLNDGEALPELNPNNPKFKLLIAIWQKLPVWLTQLIGPRVVKFLP